MPKKITRRDFLKIVAVGGAAGVALKLGLDSLPADEIISKKRLLMGTVVNIKAVGLDPGLAEAAINSCFARMSAHESVLSRFLPNSQLSELNQVGGTHDPHPALLTVLRQSQELSQLTDGAFDVTIHPLLSLYQSSQTLPADDAIQQALGLVDYRKLKFDENSAHFEQPGMSITLDGIAKGFIVDEGVTELQNFGFTNVMVEAGGDLMALGEKYPQSPWKIGLQTPRAKAGKLLTTLNIENQALATSGDYLQAFSPGFSNHHIIDPCSGYSSLELASVSVLAPSVMLADGLATSVMVMGKSGLDLIEQIPNCEAFAVTKKATVLKTSGFKEI
ncbi:MAG: FAD:protein FMN transferase [Chloroflexi bacterium]|nr:FAD:protein FMN transferase [Chloroflexota bacterium]